MAAGFTAGLATVARPPGALPGPAGRARPAAGARRVVRPRRRAPDRRRRPAPGPGPPHPGRFAPARRRRAAVAAWRGRWGPPPPGSSSPAWAATAPPASPTSSPPAGSRSPRTRPAAWSFGMPGAAVEAGAQLTLATRGDRAGAARADPGGGPVIERAAPRRRAGAARRAAWWFASPSCPPCARRSLAWHRGWTPSSCSRDVASRAATGGPVERLIDEVTIKETYFLRHREELDAIDWRALAAQAATARRGQVRVWSAACASGEEPYSLALLALEAFAPGPAPIDVLATDIAASALARGRAGPLRRALGPPRRRRPCERGGSSRTATASRSAPPLRALVRFARHNLLSDPIPPAGEAPFDLIVCRNVLIYFRPDVVRRTIDRLRAALVPGGPLLLGAADRLITGPQAARAARPARPPAPRERRRPRAAGARARAAAPSGRRPPPPAPLDADDELERGARRAGERRRRYRGRGAAPRALPRSGRRCRRLPARARPRAPRRRGGRPGAPTGRPSRCSRSAPDEVGGVSRARPRVSPRERGWTPLAGSSVRATVPRRVLVIDDSDLIREVAKLALGRAGWETLTASGGREGAAVAAARQPDAILLDVVMDDLDGPATLALLRAQEATRETPVLFLTAKRGARRRRRRRPGRPRQALRHRHPRRARSLRRSAGPRERRPRGAARDLGPAARERSRARGGRRAGGAGRRRRGCSTPSCASERRARPTCSPARPGCSASPTRPSWPACSRPRSSRTGPWSRPTSPASPGWPPSCARSSTASLAEVPPTMRRSRRRRPPSPLSAVRLLVAGDAALAAALAAETAARGVRDRGARRPRRAAGRPALVRG